LNEPIRLREVQKNPFYRLGDPKVFAVIKAGGHQYTVQQGDEVTIDYLAGNEGDAVVFDKVLMVGGEKPVFGAPLVASAKVEAVIKKQTHDPKILVFKFKRRKNYKKTRGHKQPVTVVEIRKIVN
jgi:large subunit ribosomal protein L21